MKRIGLTGGIASGKSTVAAMLAARGLPVIDADQVARDIVAPGTEGLAAVVDAFGPGVQHSDGSLDREALGAIVMADSAARARLNALTHPRIRAEIRRRLDALQSAGAGAAVIEAALMVETGSFSDYDTVVLVACSPDTQLSRLQARQGWTAERARRWLAAQLSVDARRARLQAAEAAGGPSCVVVDNDGDRTALEHAVGAAWRRLSELLVDAALSR